MPDTHDEQPAAPDEVILQVRLRPEHVKRMRSFAAREGSTVEALAALWLEEKLDEASRTGGAGQKGGV